MGTQGPRHRRPETGLTDAEIEGKDIPAKHPRVTYSPGGEVLPE